MKFKKNNSIIFGVALVPIFIISLVFMFSNRRDEIIVLGVDSLEYSEKDELSIQKPPVKIKVNGYVSIQEPLVEVTEYVDVQEFGANADANYYNEADNTYYMDIDYTIEATDNTKAFEAAFNSGHDIIIPKGNWYVGERVTITEGLEIEANEAVIYTRSSEKYKYLFYIKGDSTIIRGMTVKTTLDQVPLILNIYPEAGVGSNVFAFVVEADDVLIDKVTTINACRGVNKGTQVHNKNLTINQSKFYNATIPVFAFYIDGMQINESYLEANGLGLGTGFHSLYLSAYAKNVEVVNSTLVFNSENNGGIIQIYTSKEVMEPIIENITIKDTIIESKASHLLVLGKVKGVIIDNVTFTKHESYTDNERNFGKIMYLHDYVYDVLIQNSELNFFDTSSVMNANVHYYDNIVLKDNNITTNFTKGTNLFTSLFDYTIDSNIITVKERTGGNVFGFSGGGTITFMDNILVSEADDLVLGSSFGSGTLNLSNNQFICEDKESGVCFYNNNDKQLISAIGNTFIGFDQLVQDNANKAVIDIDNIFMKSH